MKRQHKSIQAARNKSAKRSYTALSKRQYRIMKLVEKKEQANDFLYGKHNMDKRGFYTRMPRLTNGQVDWDNVPPLELLFFQDANKSLSCLDRYSDKEIEKVKWLFKETQFSLSESY